MNKIFIDTAAWLALVNKSDEFHERAKAVREDLFKKEAEFVTTNQIVIEVSNSLSKARFRESAIKLIDSIGESKDITVVWIDEGIYAHGWEKYKSKSDKEWSFTDCMSFVIMEEERIQEAFTTDHHFEQAGFIKLL